MPRKSIFNIFKILGATLKYGGYATLPGFYEDGIRSKHWKAFVNHIWPAISLCLQMFCAFSTSYFIFIINYVNNLTDFLVVFTFFCGAVWLILCPIFFRLSVSRHLVTYLKMNEQIEPLLKPKKRQLVKWINFAFLINTLFISAVYCGVINILRFKLTHFFDQSLWYYKHLLTWQNITLALGPLGLANSLGQPLFLYICLHRILKTAFDELAIQIKENRNTKNNIQALENLKKFGKLHLQLCQLCKLLDELIHSLLFIRIATSCCVEVTLLSFFTVPQNLMQAIALSPMLNNLAIVTLPAIFAKSTTHSASKIIPAFFSSFDLVEKEKKEMEVITIQNLQLKHTFTASGILKLNGDLIVTCLQTFVSYGVIFHKINKNCVQQIECETSVIH